MKYVPITNQLGKCHSSFASEINCPDMWVICIHVSPDSGRSEFHENLPESDILEVEDHRMYVSGIFW